MPALIVIILLAANALYVAAEFSSVAARKTRIEQLAQEGNPFARRLVPIISSPRRLDSYIAASQVGITISSLLLGAYAQHTYADALSNAITPLFQTAAKSVATAVTLFGLVTFQVVLAELVPKAITMRQPIPIALATVIPMRWSLLAYSWLIVILNGTANLIVKLFNVNPDLRRPSHTADELDVLVEDSHERGFLDDNERERLRAVLRLESTKVKDIMIPRTKVFAVADDTPIDELLNIATSTPYTRIPVYHQDMDEILGVMHIKDLLVSSLFQNKSFKLSDLCRPMPMILETLPVVRVLPDMRNRHIHMAVVVDEYGGTSGIVTLEDFLEEIVGDIPDEFPKSSDCRIVALEDGSYQISGFLRLDELSSEMNLDIDYEDADTVAGLVMGVLGRIPVEGDTVSYGNAVFEVVSLEQNAVETVILRLTADSSDESETGDGR